MSCKFAHGLFACGRVTFLVGIASWLLSLERVAAPRLALLPARSYFQLIVDDLCEPTPDRYWISREGSGSYDDFDRAMGRFTMQTQSRSSSGTPAHLGRTPPPAGTRRGPTPLLPMAHKYGSIPQTPEGVSMRDATKPIVGRIGYALLSVGAFVVVVNNTLSPAHRTSGTTTLVEQDVARVRDTPASPAASSESPQPHVTANAAALATDSPVDFITTNEYTQVDRAPAGAAYSFIPTGKLVEPNRLTTFTAYHTQGEELEEVGVGWCWVCVGGERVWSRSQMTRGGGGGGGGSRRSARRAPTRTCPGPPTLRAHAHQQLVGPPADP